ncbi:hypothetical protein BY996DRAFT_6422264 [Phakopsora pachyrhizi]|nr:hypothetical protein BY996DRAFT_6422264 [Phakopsora pachyrhizi]
MLTALNVQIFEWAAPKGTSYSNKAVKERFKDKKTRQRFALLRVFALYQHFHNHDAPWPEIDLQLEKLKKQSSAFRNAFYTLIFEIDNYLAKKTIGEINLQRIIPPTNDQVEIEMKNQDMDSVPEDRYSSEED